MGRCPLGLSPALTSHFCDHKRLPGDRTWLQYYGVSCAQPLDSHVGVLIAAQSAEKVLIKAIAVKGGY